MKSDCIVGSIKLTIFLLEEDGNFYDTNIEFLVANKTIKLNDVILGTLWLRQHEATLELKQDFKLQLTLKAKAGAWAMRNLSLKPEAGKFELNRN